jgi:hypothetical protein
MIHNFTWLKAISTLGIEDMYPIFQVVLFDVFFEEFMSPLRVCALVIHFKS